ncbi:MAG: copper homeostasis protein CutC [Bacteroidia bacterium]
MLLELATFHPDSIPAAIHCGVERLELCEDYSCGGLTPSISYFETARDLFPGKIFVMIRPRTGGYIFSEDELGKMIATVKEFVSRGADGFVCGFFKSEQEIHVTQLRKFIDACDGRPVTFHRSFDAIINWQQGLDMLIQSGVSRLLTSGDGKGAYEGRYRLAEMIKQAGTALTILPGGGIRSSNVQELISACHPTELHTAALKTDGSELADEAELAEILRRIG